MKVGEVIAVCGFTPHPGMGNKECNPCPLLLLQSFDRFESIETRHVDVEHYHAGLESMCKLDRCAATEHNAHIQTKHGQECAQRLCPLTVVIYD